MLVYIFPAFILQYAYGIALVINAVTGHHYSSSPS